MTLITGTAGLLDGTLYRNATLKFFLNPQAVRVEDARLLFPTPILVQSDSNALVAFRLAHGAYTGVDMATKKTFAFTVPDEDEVEWTACVDPVTPAPETPTFAAGQLTGTLQPAQVPAFTGDVTSAGGSYALTITDDAVSNAKLANMAAKTVKANLTASAANPTDATVAEMRNLLMQVDVDTRAELVAWAAANTPILGLTSRAAGAVFRYIGTGTAISDMPGWVPMDRPSPAHWSNGPGSAVDNTVALVAWAAYLSAQNPGVEGFLPGGEWRHTAPLVFTGERSRVIRGIGGNVIDGGSRLEYIGTALDAANGALRLSSALNYEFTDICFICRTAGCDYHIKVMAEVSPALSSHFVRFRQCSMITAGSGSVLISGILMASGKFIELDGCSINYNGHFGVICGEDNDATLISGTLAQGIIRNSMIFNDIGIYRSANLIIDNNSFETKSIDGGTGCIVPLGELKASSVSITENTFIDDGAKTETRAAITTSPYAGTTSLAAASGWIVKGNIFRDRLTSIHVKGGVNIASNIFMQRTSIPGSVGIRIDDGCDVDQIIQIDPDNDFSQAFRNGMVAIEDNRTALSGSAVVFHRELSVDTAKVGAGTADIFAFAPIRDLRGGLYRVCYLANFLNQSGATEHVSVMMNIGGVEYGTRTRQQLLHNAQGSFACSRVVRLPPTTGSAPTIRLQINSTGNGTIRGSGSLGATFLTLEEIP